MRRVERGDLRVGPNLSAVGRMVGGMERVLREMLDGLDEGYRLLGPVGFVSAFVLFMLVLTLLGRAV